ncbi:LacI family DNA-binding transcriptional regulator [Paracandidimonas soli]|uniref:LacI family transcriptional regulator n=1 Tax=Paracandidimonas soli TaxID=1917182 RepID=A0A4R3V459_9BURK|nr:LacI family DNA-binding transcriptional regulator [Paracandidimonas soli]TCU98500.1 LacI family transcriptional regulator [Paracandidimonas soli]
MTIDSELPGSSTKRASRPRANSLTVRDVAKAAGVSPATVSRVLNGNDRVDEKLRKHVERVADDLGYTPHAAARALASQRSHTIAAVVPSLEDPNFAVGVSALQQALTVEGYTLLIANSNYDEEEELRQVRALAAHGIAGMMLVGAQHSSQVYDLLETRNIPFVNTWVLDKGHPSVGFDNYQIGRTVANYLLDLGHTCFGVVAQRSPRSDRAASRLAGIRAALQERAGYVPHEYVIDRSHRIMDGQHGLRMLLALPDRPTAIICGTDTLAFGVLVEAQAQGLRVPEDLSVTGINDVEFAAHLTPPLTTVRLAVSEVGMHAAEYLLARIEGRPTLPAMSIPFSLIVRGSTGSPKR